MSLIYLQMKRVANICRYFLMVVVSLYALQAHAADTSTVTVTVISASDMLHNISDQLPNLMRLVTAIAYVTGMYLIFFGILKLKQYGEARTQMSNEHSLRGPLVYMTIGAMLLYLPSSVQMGLSTFWATPSPYGYLQQADQWASFMQDFFMVIQLFGTITFIKGLLVLSHLSSHHGQQGQFAKGITHVIGGLLCINMYQLLQVVMITLGIQT